MEEKIQNNNKEEINFIPLIVLHKNIEITDVGIEYYIFLYLNQSLNNYLK